MKRALAAALCLLAAACAPLPHDAPQARPPRLVVLLAIDGFPQWQLTRYREQLAAGGLRRFLDRGAWFADAHHGHALTVTAAGHAVMLTGAYPHRSGIIENDWRARATGERIGNTADPAHAYIGHATRPGDGTSPKNLRVEALGDVLRRLQPAAKVVAISGKDRGAILPAGHAGIAYMYQARTGRFASSTYYMREHPAWVAAFDARKPADAFFHRVWRPLLPEAAYAASMPDGQAWYAPGGRLPKTLGEGAAAPGAKLYGELLASPFGDELTLDFARAAIAGEALGADDVPDILALSLSGHDYVNHLYTAESRLSHDHTLQLDRQLQAFFEHLDATVGADRYLVALTADHGFTPAPEQSRASGRDAGRLDLRQLLSRINDGLALQFGEGRWLRFITYADLWVDRGVAAKHRVRAEDVAAEAQRLLVREPGIAAAFTAAEIESGSRRGEAYFTAVERSWHRDLSGDIQFVLKPYWIPGGYPTGTTHGSPHPYDTHVPLAFYGPAWVKPARVDARVEIADLAPTLAAILGVPPPAAAEGRALPLR